MPRRLFIFLIPLTLAGCAVMGGLQFVDRRHDCPPEPPPTPEVNRDVDASPSLGALRQECRVCWKTVDVWERGYQRCTTED